MKLFIAAIGIGLVMGWAEWVALDVVTADLSAEMQQKHQVTVSSSETPVQGLYVGQSYALTTQHMQPAYNMLGRTITTQELQ